MSELAEILYIGLLDFGEDVILRRVNVGSANVDVTCRARVDVVNAEMVAAGIKETDLDVIISPKELTAANWPGTGQAVDGPDKRVPLINTRDKMIVRGVLRTIVKSDPKFINNELVRINIRVSG